MKYDLIIDKIAFLLIEKENSFLIKIRERTFDQLMFEELKQLLNQLIFETLDDEYVTIKKDKLIVLFDLIPQLLIYLQGTSRDEEANREANMLLGEIDQLINEWLCGPAPAAQQAPVK